MVCQNSDQHCGLLDKQYRRKEKQAHCKILDAEGGIKLSP
jgi:hypothetical protein